MRTDFDYLRKGKAEEMSSMYRQGIKKCDELCVEEYNDAIILPGKRPGNLSVIKKPLGGVVDKAGEFVKASKDSIFTGGIYEVATLHESNKSVMYCGYFKHHWGHFLVDNVPRLWYVLERQKEIDEYIMIDLEGSHLTLKGNFLEFFEMLGISDKVRILTVPTKFKCVIIPQLAYRRTAFCKSCGESYYSQKYIQTFEYVIDKAMERYSGHSSISKNVFLTRSGLSFSEERDCGIEIIDNFFENNGYSVISPEKISLKEFIHIMNNCINFSCIQGTLPHNLLFTKNNVNVIIIERSPYINSTQNEINMMKTANVSFVDANCYIFPTHTCFGPFVYIYNKYLEKFAKDTGMKLPNYQYTIEEYRNNVIMEYLKKYCLPVQPWGEEYKTEYVLEAGNECIHELYPDFQFDAYQSLSEFMKEYKIRKRVMNYLIEYHMEYSGWKNLDMYQEFVKTIEKAIDSGKTEFLIYPFGRNGLFFKQILNERYGIEEKAIFDNSLCRYNNQIRHLRDINMFYHSKACLVLTSSKVDCRNELLKYCKMDMLEGPFTLL